jgi:diacylglycerol kinase (ATP)
MIKNFNISRIIKATSYSIEGLKSAYSTEIAFRQELMLLAVTLPIAFFLNVAQAERILLLGSIILVLIVEVLNTAIETIVERISSEQHELSKKAKDLGSAAVFLSLVYAVVVWGMVLL